MNDPSQQLSLIKAWEGLLVISIAILSKELFEYQMEASVGQKGSQQWFHPLSLLPVRDTLV